METTEITQQEALENIRLVLENFVGKKEQHVILEKSYNKIIADLSYSNAQKKISEVKKNAVKTKTQK